MNEEWKTIPRYSHCEVSNTGKVRYKEDFYMHCHTHTVRERPQKLAGFGYFQVNLIPEDRSTYGNTESVHNLVAEAFIGPCPEKGYRAHHKDENKTNNSPDNLQWLSHGENMVRSYNHETRASLSENNIKQIRCIKKRYNLSQRATANMFKVSQTTINRVWNAERYISKEGTYV